VGLLALGLAVGVPTAAAQTPYGASYPYTGTSSGYNAYPAAGYPAGGGQYNANGGQPSYGQAGYGPSSSYGSQYGTYNQWSPGQSGLTYSASNPYSQPNYGPSIYGQSNYGSNPGAYMPPANLGSYNYAGNNNGGYANPGNTYGSSWNTGAPSYNSGAPAYNAGAPPYNPAAPNSYSTPPNNYGAGQPTYTPGSSPGSYGYVSNSPVYGPPPSYGAPPPPSNPIASTSQQPGSVVQNGNQSYTLGQYMYGVGTATSIPYSLQNTTPQVTPYNQGALASYLTGVASLPGNTGQPGILIQQPIDLGN